MADIGKRIREKRESIGMTQEELAAKLGYKNKSSIAKIEIGANDIVQSKVVEFAKALGTTVAYLMGWEESKPDIAIVSPDNKILCIVECMRPPKKERALRLMQYYSMLNEIGQKKALDNLEDLSKIYAEKKPEKYDFTPPEHSMVAETSTPYLAAAHNDHLDEEGELDKVKSDLAKLKKTDEK